MLLFASPVEGVLLLLKKFEEVLNNELLFGGFKFVLVGWFVLENNEEFEVAGNNEFDENSEGVLVLNKELAGLGS